jgi:acyl-CoA thioester hydrolase
MVNRNHNLTGFTHQFPVNWVDTDALSVVHFSNYFRYFEKTEDAFYRSLKKKERELLERHQVSFPRVEAHCTYKSPLRYGDVAEVEISLDDMTDRSVKLHFEVRNVTRKVDSASGHITLVCVDTRSWKAVSIPEEVRKIYRKLR